MTTILLLGVAKADACDDAELDRRCRLAAGLWRETRNARVIACGGRQKVEQTSEAADMRGRLMELDVGEGLIILEEESRATMENLRNAASLLGKEVDDRVLVVTSDYHLPRVRLATRRLGLSVEAHGAKTTPKLRRRWPHGTI